METEALNFEITSKYIWINWQSWSKFCERQCSLKAGLRFRQKDCVLCTNVECFKVDYSFCSQNDSQFRETQYCYQGLFKK